MKQQIAEIVANTIHQIAHANGFTGMEVIKPDESKKKRRARRVAIYHLRKCGFPNHVVAKAFGMEREKCSGAAQVLLNKAERDLCRELPQIKVKTRWVVPQGHTIHKETIESIQTA